MGETGLKHHLDNIKHQSAMYQTYQDALSLDSLTLSRELIVHAFMKQQREINRQRGESMTFQLIDKDTSEEVTIYAVDRVKDQTLFLTYSEYVQGFAWIDSSYFEPKSTTSTE